MEQDMEWSSLLTLAKKPIKVLKRVKITITNQQDKTVFHVTSKGQNNFKNFWSIHELNF